MSSFLDDLRQYQVKIETPANSAKAANDGPADVFEPADRSGNSEISSAVVERCHEGARNRLLALAAEGGHPDSLVNAISIPDLVDCEGRGDGELRAYLLALAGQARMRRGLAPLSWGEPAARWCEGCGPVELWESCPPVVKACPWCWNRRAKKPISRPMLTCELCVHFVLSPHTPTAGGGTCKVGHGGHNPMQVHRCADWRQENPND